MSLRPIGVLLVCTAFLAATAASADQIFTNVTAAAGIVESGASFGQAVAWGDCDDDGDLDLAFSYTHGSSLRLYRNDGGSFVNITGAAGLAGVSGAVIVWAEVTGDAYPDLILGNKLYANDGDGSFSLRSGTGILGSVAATADLDHDGKLDLISLNGALTVLWGNGNGTFSPAAIGGSSATTLVCLDYDLDGRQDIYLGTYSGDNHLYRNEGARSFVDETASAGVSCTRSTSGVTTGDYDNDGWPDLYVGNHRGQLSDPDNRLYRNNGDGSFSNLSASAGTPARASTRTAAFADYDNDGWLDLLVNDHYYGNKLYRNNRDGSFTDQADPLHLDGGFGDYFGMGWGDYNGDGALDLFVAGHFHIYRLHRNDNCPGNWLTLKLIGAEGNRDAVGTRVELFRDGLTLTRWVTAGEGYNDFHSLDLEFGLGDELGADSLRIHWPGGEQLHLGATAANQFLEIEQNGDPTAVDEHPADASPALGLTAYPNPFNPRTTLGFFLESEASVTLRIHDSSGRRVATLIDRRILAAGAHEQVWTGTDLPSGVYLARLETGGRTRSTRMLLMK